MGNSRSRITAQMLASIGGVVDRRVSWPVSPSDIRRWAIAVYYPDPPPRRYQADQDEGPLVAPEEFNPFAWSAREAAGDGTTHRGADPDWIEKRLGLPALGLAHQLNGGSAVTYAGPIRSGDVITSVTTLAGYREKRGRLGLMLITDLASTWTNQLGAEVRHGVDTSIRYRGSA